MSQELDFELVEDSTDGWDEVTVETNDGTAASDSNESTTDSEDQNTSSTKSKKSNWKKMAKLNKALKAENAKLRQQAAQVSQDNDDIDDEDFDDVEVFDRTEFRFFTIENPEAKEFSSEIENIVSDNPNMSFEDALTLAKAKKPKQSTSSDDFSTKSANAKVRKRLEDLTEDEALKLSNSKYLEYQRLKGKVR